MSLIVRNNSTQVQAQGNNEQSFWQRKWIQIKSTVKWTGIGTLAGGALYVGMRSWSRPMDVASNAINAVTGIFRKNIPEAITESTEHLARAGDQISLRTTQSFERTAQLTADTATTIMTTVTDRACSSYDNTVTTAFSEVKATRQLIAVAVGSGIAIVLYSACKDDDSICTVGKPLAFLTALSGSVYLIAKGVFEKLRSGAAQLRSGPEISMIPVTDVVILSNLRESLPQGCTPLMEAALKGDLPKTMYLQSRGENLNARDASGRTALHYAAFGGQQQTFELLWYFGADLRIEDRQADYQHNWPIHYIDRSNTTFRSKASQLLDSTNRFSLPEPVYDFYPPESLIFKGGGPKGIAYVGIQKYLEEHDYFRSVKQIAGTSAGAINAALVGLGCTAKDMQRILGQTDLKSFLDHPYQSERELLQAAGQIFQKGGDTTWNETIDSVEKLYNWWNSKGSAGRPADVFKKVYHRGGLCEGKKVLKWIEDQIASQVFKVCKKGKEEDYRHLTFRELEKLIEEGCPFKHLYLYATKINDPNEKIVCMSAEEERWKDVPIADAVRASMSIPIVFEPYILRVKDKNGSLRDAPGLGEFVDGGLLRNLPIETFDIKKYRSTNDLREEAATNWQTLAFNLVDPASDAPSSSSAQNTNILGVLKQTGAVYASGEEILFRMNSQHQMRTIDIDNCGVGLVSGFFATKKEKFDLIRSGYAAGVAFARKQKDLAERYKEHNPRKILTIDLKNSVPIPAVDLAEEPEEERKIPPPIAQEVFSREEEEKTVSLVRRAAIMREPSGSMTLVTETEETARIIRRRKLKTIQETQSRVLEKQKNLDLLVQALLNEQN